jgi:hypothetical protein
MELNFDKEIEALLRQQSARESEGALANENPQSAIRNSHLDADEISAFAENALPEKIRQNYVLHLADCERCRKNLSNLILLNADTEIQTVRHSEKEAAALPIPWYRNLFATPNLAYTLGALVLVFSGIAVFTILQNGDNARNMEVSQISERQTNGKGMSSDGDATQTETYSSNAMSNTTMMSSNTAAMNSSSANSSNFAIPASPIATANSNAAVSRERDKDALPDAKSPVAENAPTDLAKTENSVAGNAPQPTTPAKENNDSAENETQSQQPVQNSPVQNQTTITPDSRNVQSSPKLTRRAEDKSKKLEESRSDRQEKSVETTSVGGKTFKRTNNVWYDSAYRGQATVNVTRGTNEYKKLDSGLRGIAENLGGTFVVVWKEKAYRIQ